MPVDDDDMIVSTRDYLVSESTLNPLATPAEVQTFALSSKATAHVTITVGQGGVRNVILTEKTRATDAESNAIRKAMGMDYEVRE